MGYVGYQTPISQDDYLIVGIISAVVGFLLLAYFFMYLLWYLVIKLHSKSIKERLEHKSWLPYLLHPYLVLESLSCFCMWEFIYEYWSNDNV